MKPDPIVLELIDRRDAAVREADRRRRAELHRRAVARRKKAKRGGPR